MNKQELLDNIHIVRKNVCSGIPVIGIGETLDILEDDVLRLLTDTVNNVLDELESNSWPFNDGWKKTRAVPLSAIEQARKNWS